MEWKAKTLTGVHFPFKNPLSWNIKIWFQEPSNPISSTDSLCNSSHSRNVRGEPAASYRWTGWVWEITGWSSRLLKNCQLLKRNLTNIPRFDKRKPERCQHVNRVDMETLGYRPTMTKNLSGHCSRVKELMKSSICNNPLDFSKLLS